METIVVTSETVSRPGRQGDSQQSWVLASQNGDTVAFNRLVLKWQGKIYNLTLRMLGNPEEAAEATQETFLRAFKNIRRFRLDAQFSTWLYRIASNECLSQLRRPSSRRHHDSLDGRDEEAATLHEQLQSGDDQEEELYRSERQHRVRVALSALPREQRLAVELKFFQEQTFEEMGEILDTPVSTVKSRFYKGLQGLKKRLT